MLREVSLSLSIGYLGQSMFQIEYRVIRVFIKEFIPLLRIEQ